MPKEELILTRITDVLKTDYLPLFDNQLTTDPSPFLEKIKKESLVSDPIHAAAPYGLVGGFGFSAEGEATPAAAHQKYIPLRE